MASLRRRLGKWQVLWRDEVGRQRGKSFGRQGSAKLFKAEIELKTEQRLVPAVDAGITVAEYAVRWLQMIRPQLKRGTLLGYESVLRIHVVPAIGPVPVRKLTRATVKELIVAVRRKRTQHTCVRIHRTLRAMLSWAIDDEVLSSNPAERLGKVLALHKTRAQKQDKVRAMTRPERDAFMVVVRKYDPELAGLFMTMGWAGLRIGEALALRVGDFDESRRELHVNRSIDSSDRSVSTTKTGVGRVVMCSAELRSELLSTVEHRSDREGLLWPTGRGTPFEHSNVEKRMKKVLREAGLPMHFSPHSLRHTYARLMLEGGVDLKTVQQQMGHASIQLTADTYGQWFKPQQTRTADVLDSGHDEDVSMLRGQPS